MGEDANGMNSTQVVLRAKEANLLQRTRACGSRGIRFHVKPENPACTHARLPIVSTISPCR